MDDQEKRIQQAYADGWKDSENMIYWEMRALIDENENLKIKIRKHEQFSKNIKNILC